MPFDPANIRIERLLVELRSHAAYSYWSLRGVLAERWAHGPDLGAYADLGEEVRLSPPLEAQDRRLVASYGLKHAALLAEGPEWTPRAPSLAKNWIADAHALFEPVRTTLLRVQLFGIHPVRDPDRASQRLRARFYHDDELAKIVPTRFAGYHAAVEVLCLEGAVPMSCIIGVVGPHHRFQGFFAFPDDERDASWWMGVRLEYLMVNEDAIETPVELLSGVIDEAHKDFRRIAMTVLPELVG